MKTTRRRFFGLVLSAFGLGKATLLRARTRLIHETFLQVVFAPRPGDPPLYKTIRFGPKHEHNELFFEDVK
jgi:hypothetical protein